jgi:hypothetical protein
MNWKIKFEQELDMARAARARGNEGQARVCARRAAGVAAREYFQRSGLSPRSTSAYDLLNDLLASDSLSPRARHAAEALTQRVTEEFKLPEELDLSLEARALAASLLPQD